MVLSGYWSGSDANPVIRGISGSHTNTLALSKIFFVLNLGILVPPLVPLSFSNDFLILYLEGFWWWCQYPMSSHMFFHFVFQRTANIPTFLQIFVFFCIRRGIGSATNISLRFQRYFLLRIQGVGSAGQTLELSYVLFVSYWWCRQYP